MRMAPDTFATERTLIVLAVALSFLAALVLAALIGMSDSFPGKARMKARRWLLILLAVAVALLLLESVLFSHAPDFGSLRSHSALTPRERFCA